MASIYLSCSTLKRIVCVGKQAEGGQVCLTRKRHDKTNKPYLTSDVREDHVDLLAEFAHTWRRLTIRHLHLLMQGKGYEFCTTTIFRHLKLMNMRYETMRLKPILTERVRVWRLQFALSLIDLYRGHLRDGRPRKLFFKPLWDWMMADEKWSCP